MNIWHNTRVLADEYWVCRGTKVLFGIPKWLGRLIDFKKGAP